MEVPFDDALLFLYSKGEEDSERLPEKMAEKRENLGKLQIAFASLTDDEKELIWFLYSVQGAADRNTGRQRAAYLAAGSQ